MQALEDILPHLVVLAVVDSAVEALVITRVEEEVVTVEETDALLVLNMEEVVGRPTTSMDPRSLLRRTAPGTTPCMGQPRPISPADTALATVLLWSICVLSALILFLEHVPCARWVHTVLGTVLPRNVQQVHTGLQLVFRLHLHALVVRPTPTAQQEPPPAPPAPPTRGPPLALVNAQPAWDIGLSIQCLRFGFPCRRA